MLLELLQFSLGLFAVFLIAQSVFNLYVTLYAWDDPERMENARAPKSFRRPKHGFTVLLPCRHEEAVIGETVRKLSQAKYPKKD